MNNNAWIIWNELIKSDYIIKSLNIRVSYYPLTPYYNTLEIKIIFDDFNFLEKFTNDIFKNFGLDIHIDNYDNSFVLELKNSNQTHETNNNILENLKFPYNVITIIITEKYNYYEYKYDVKLHNLPKNLSQLKISSTKISFDLSNLPTSLILLDIESTTNKFNLNYLPDSLKILYLPKMSFIHCDVNNEYFSYVYELKDLMNLPSSLIEINIKTGNDCRIGENNNIVYKSTKELIDNFKKITKIYKFDDLKILLSS